MIRRQQLRGSAISLFLVGGANLCMAADQVGQGPASLVAGGQTLVVDAASGDVTCPDGTMINIGAGTYGDCPAFRSFLVNEIVDCVGGECP